MISTRTQRSGKTLPLSNRDIADQFDHVADLLDARNSNPYRVRAYRGAAETLRQLKQPVHEILQSRGRAGLMDLPGIGKSLAFAIEQLAYSGQLPLLERLQGDIPVESVFRTVPGIGPQLAARIHQELGIDSLAELELAAYDGRLAQLPGFGGGRIRAIRESLAGRFRRAVRFPPARTKAEHIPSVAELLDIDRQYREAAATGQLVHIAPQRFNPSGEAWLPVMRTRRGKRYYTVLYSNTARAHELGMTQDWVVIYRNDQGGTGQWTVITAPAGKLKGCRIVRGRELECIEYYRSLNET